MPHPESSNVPVVLEALRAGQMVLVTDDADREHEGDLIVATAAVTAQHVAFMANEARGLICVTLSPEQSVRLQLPLQTNSNNAPFKTAFTVSVDHHSVAASGVSAEARAVTMRALIDPAATSEDFIVPGHVFPLVANPSGVFGRQGHTEAAHDLSRLAGFSPSGVICEVLNADGTVARGALLDAFAARHSIPMTSVRDIIRYRERHEVVLRETRCTSVQTDYGRFDVHTFFDDASGVEHLALSIGDLRSGHAQLHGVLTRIHSECLTGDVFGSRRCDCGAQLAQAARLIQEQGEGVLLYLRQEGRGIGLANKLRAYELQDQGHDTVDANVKLGFPADARDFAVAARILRALGVDAVRLLTNNPDKVTQLQRHAVAVRERVALKAPVDAMSDAYMRTKRERMGHIL